MTDPAIQPSSLDRSALTALSIRLATADRVVFFLLVDQGGLIQRQGTARLRDPAGALHVGVTRDPIFAHLVEALPAEIADQPGSYVLPGDGTPLLLQIALWTAAGPQELAISYGADGDGPPEPIVQFVLRARAWSDPWYGAQR